MVNKYSFFITTAYYNLLRFLPHKKQQFAEYLEDIAETVSSDLTSLDVLEIWFDSFEFGGLILGNIALFLIGFLLMAAADILLRRTSNVGIASFINFLSGLYCVDKFSARSHRAAQNALIFLYVSVSVLFGFHWLITMSFLVLFTNSEVITRKGVTLC